MERETVLYALTAQKYVFAQKYGVTQLGIFGSVARGQATEGSDVDVVVEMPPDIFQMVHLKEDIEALLGVPVDLIRLHKNLNAYLKSRIDREAIFV
ncbi:MAG: nucleotidyltransferase domain-containing protein [Caldilinea sp.]|uniref:nucleotidyltransferase family protein n=1 Tax=Caldilinea sp. TaxID=2293560 RepID=UPI002BC31C09|nr:nucleotidyltransferase domain-containing protein [Anaerolineales bacterium]HQY91168.1 nucleotidyltransferase domain-containing protein [Caldilinea sp.]